MGCEIGKVEEGLIVEGFKCWLGSVDFFFGGIGELWKIFREESGVDIIYRGGEIFFW